MFSNGKNELGDFFYRMYNSEGGYAHPAVVWNQNGLQTFPGFYGTHIKSKTNPY